MSSPVVPSPLVAAFSKNPFLYVLESINRIMDFYNRYKKTIKEVSKRHYNKRIIWVNEYLANKSCVHCNESETMCLKFYPHDKTIRYKSKRLGLNEQSRQEVVELIDDSKIVCSNCYIKYQNDLIDIM